MKFNIISRNKLLVLKINYFKWLTMNTSMLICMVDIQVIDDININGLRVDMSKFITCDRLIWSTIITLLHINFRII